ncbi:hypothetical protein [Rhizobium leguminosarum]|uniref:hypothetical protein n=1 Tax=Rhizobium TaxID=379 RepID=UPI0010325613|nr:hypothetical protein [Rhizobium leguminosarum]TAV40656.1 hypothetical protein ELI31_35345 [Rhizobium leguminosarum]TAV41224.1 hypothetical protein ELI32_35340 [Rhizobium leguminosarum]TAV61089.1 hypothetical protein ELI30_35130 [Rhizobium leguminosarum]
MSSAFVGTWTYRSFVSDPNLDAPFDGLEFGRANLVISEPTAGIVGGSIGGTGWSLALNGTMTPGNPETIRFTGSGPIGNENWVYDYLGFLAPAWPNGIDQRPAIVGTIIRTVPHGQAPAGFVAQWIAVRQ